MTNPMSGYGTRMRCGVAGVLACAVTHSAVMFSTAIDTSALIGHADGPFSLAFQFVDGEGVGDGNNTVTLESFQFGGGGWAGGGPGTIVLTDDVFFTDFVHAFTPGTSLSFAVEATTVVDSGGVPDLFSFAILDNSGFEIPTTGFGDAMLLLELSSSSPYPEVFGTDTARTDIAIPTPVIIPEVGGAVWGMPVVALLFAARRGRGRRRVNEMRMEDGQ